MIRCRVYGKEYTTLEEASKDLSVHYETVKRRCVSALKKWDQWELCDPNSVIVKQRTRVEYVLFKITHPEVDGVYLKVSSTPGKVASHFAKGLKDSGLLQSLYVGKNMSQVVYTEILRTVSREAVYIRRDAEYIRLQARDIPVLNTLDRTLKLVVNPLTGILVLGVGKCADLIGFNRNVVSKYYNGKTVFDQLALRVSTDEIS